MNALAQALRPLLEAVARRQETITYAALARAAAVPPPHTIHQTVEALEVLLTEDAAAGRPLLAAVVVSRARSENGHGMPAPGFFQKATVLGRYFGPDRGPQAATFHALELQQVWDAFQGPSPD